MITSAELKHLHYGFAKDGVDEVTSPADVETTTSSRLQAVLYDDSTGCKLVAAVAEVDTVKCNGLRNARATLLRWAKHHGVTALPSATYHYGGNICRY